ncbi:MAG: sulfatase [Pseudomonadaceae bacterium]|nr:sulfatase [Pseudomonadaceae bacterium]
MSRVVALLMSALLVACAQLPALQNSRGTSAAVPPNIVILFADDLGYGDLGSYGHPYLRTPNLDTLASQGQRWTDFYVASPVCSPSRGALLTGRLPNRTGLYGRAIRVLFPGDTVGVPDSELTIAEALKSKGYATGMIGKWHLGDAPDAYPTRHGFDYWYGIPYSNDMDWTDGVSFDELVAMSMRGETEAFQAVIASRGERYFDPKVENWNVPVIRSQRVDGGFADELVERPAQQDVNTMRYTEEAVAFIERSADSPFLLYLPYSMPHTPLFRSEAFAGKSIGGRYGDVIEELDWSVGKVIAALEEQGVADNTLVIFTSDNGPWLTMRQHGGSAGLLKHGKGTTFEGGMRVPAIFWWPGRIAPAVVSDIGSAMDIYTTALSLAGVAPENPVDGLDLSPVLLDAEASPRTTLAYYREGDLYAFRKGDYKLHLQTFGAYGQAPEKTVHEVPLLYHLTSDPSERFDVATQYPDVVADILEEIAAHRARLDEKPPLFDKRLAKLGAGS